MELNEKLIHVRQGTRLLAAYYRRIVDILGLVQATLDGKTKLGLRFRRWEPWHTESIGKQTVSPVGRWGWDFVPLADAWFVWSTDKRDTPVGAGSVAVQVDHVTDTGFAVPEDETEPDPSTFRPSSECSTVLRIYVYALVRGACADSWDRIYHVNQDADDARDLHDGRVHVVPTDALAGASADALIRYVGWEVSLADLATEKDVEDRVTRVLEGHLDTIVIG